MEGEGGLAESAGAAGGAGEAVGDDRGAGGAGGGRGQELGRGAAGAGGPAASIVADCAEGRVSALGAVEDGRVAGQAGRPADVIAGYAGQAEGGAGDAGGAGGGAGLGDGVVGAVVVVATFGGAPRHAEGPVVEAAVAGGAGGSVGAGVAVVEALLAGHGGEVAVPTDRALVVA